MKKVSILLKKITKKIFNNHVYVLGDSHIEIFDYMNSEYLSWKYKFDVISIGGATAQGMRNPKSKTNALEIFNTKIDSIKEKKSKLVFQLGEVDTGFVIWYRAKKYNESVEKQLNDSIFTYIEFLKNVKVKGFRHLYVLSAPLPTIEDGQDWGEIANARGEITASQKERTDLTLKYNQILELELNKININFISLDKHLLDTQTGLIKNNLKNIDINNHHLDIDKYAKIVLKEIKKCF